MRVEEFDFSYPRELIAQEPIEPRDHARLLVLHRHRGAIEHRRFFELPEFLQAGDVLCLNDTKVLRARLIGRREGTGGKVKVLLLRHVEGGVWEALVEPQKRGRLEDVLTLGDGSLKAKVVSVQPDGARLIEFNATPEQVEEALNRLGKVPLPPYIKTDLEDDAPYQTVYARELGSVAAPTAGLHFTHELLSRIEQKGISIAKVTLHVGWATFRLMSAPNVEEHQMYEEFCRVPEETARLINDCFERGGKVFAVGTTTVRTLESAATAPKKIQPWSGWTKLFITPGFSFRIVDSLITNFHLPRSTNLVLVCAFAGMEQVRKAYDEAIRQRYRLFSFGDAMLAM